MSHDNIDMSEDIRIPSRAFWFILESSLKRNGDEDYKVPEAFTIKIYPGMHIINIIAQN